MPLPASPRHLSLLEEDILLLALEQVLRPGTFRLDPGTPGAGATVRNGPDLVPGEVARELAVRDEVPRLMGRGLVEPDPGGTGPGEPYRLTAEGRAQAEAVRAGRLALLETQQLPEVPGAPQGTDPIPGARELPATAQALLRAALALDGHLGFLKASGGALLNAHFGPGPRPLQGELDHLASLGLLRRQPLASNQRLAYDLTPLGRRWAEALAD